MQDFSNNFNKVEISKLKSQTVKFSISNNTTFDLKYNPILLYLNGKELKKFFEPILDKIKTQISKLSIPKIEKYMPANCDEFNPLDCFYALKKFAKNLDDNNQKKLLNEFLNEIYAGNNNQTIIDKTKEIIFKKVEKIILNKNENHYKILDTFFSEILQSKIEMLKLHYDLLVQDKDIKKKN